MQDFDVSTWISDITRYPVAWVDDAAEVGPRALGHRSLLGDPRSAATKDILNAVKRRQWWRPVAPMVLERHVAEWFVGGRSSPLMLQTFMVAPEYRPLVPAILHLDGTARNQTLSEADDAFLTSALAAFHRATGVPIICNTSLNDRGEPIANSAADAIAFCLLKGIEVVYIERRRVLLDVAVGTTDGETPQRPLASLYRDQDRRPAAIFGPDVDAERLYLLHFWPRLHGLAQTEDGLAQLRRIARMMARRNPTFCDRAADHLEYFRTLLAGENPPGGMDL